MLVACKTASSSKTAARDGIVAGKMNRKRRIQVDRKKSIHLRQVVAIARTRAARSRLSRSASNTCPPFPFFVPYDIA